MPLLCLTFAYFRIFCTTYLIMISATSFWFYLSKKKKRRSYVVGSEVYLSTERVPKLETRYILAAMLNTFQSRYANNPKTSQEYWDRSRMAIIPTSHGVLLYVPELNFTRGCLESFAAYDAGGARLLFCPSRKKIPKTF